jgi:dienelactone hydrolase
VPVLILQGEVDRQVTAEQAPLLEKAFRQGGNRDVTLRVFPARNHLFLRDATGEPANYPKLASYVIDGEVMGTLADWLVARLAAPAEPAGKRRE